MKRPCVYIMASRRNGTLYVGVTSDIARRATQHREGEIAGFTKRYAAIWESRDGRGAFCWRRQEPTPSSRVQRLVEIVPERIVALDQHELVLAAAGLYFSRAIASSIRSYGSIQTRSLHP